MSSRTETIEDRVDRLRQEVAELRAMVGRLLALYEVEDGDDE